MTANLLVTLLTIAILTTICYELQLSKYITVINWLGMSLQLSSFIQAWNQLIRIMNSNSVWEMTNLVVLVGHWLYTGFHYYCCWRHH